MQNDLSYSSDQPTDTFEEVFKDFTPEKISELSHVEIESILNELKEVCMEFDPYQPQNLSQELEVTLNKYGLDQMLGNPFTFTNNLLRILTMIESEYKLRS